MIQRETPRLRRDVAVRLCALLLPLFVQADSALAVSREAETFQSRFLLGVGLTKSFKPDSSGTHGVPSFGYRLNFHPRWSLGIDTGVQTVYEESDWAGTTAGVSLFRLSLISEFRPIASGGVIPFFAAGAGWYSWGRCRHEDRSEMYFCWPWSDDNRHDSFGLCAGAGVHYGMWGHRSLTLALDFHPYTTYHEDWDAVLLTLFFGW